MPVSFGGSGSRERCIAHLYSQYRPQGDVFATEKARIIFGGVSGWVRGRGERVCAGRSKDHKFMKFRLYLDGGVEGVVMTGLVETRLNESK